MILLISKMEKEIIINYYRICKLLIGIKVILKFYIFIEQKIKIMDVMNKLFSESSLIYLFLSFFQNSMAYKFIEYCIIS